jgi:hypothetical protein
MQQPYMQNYSNEQQNWQQFNGTELGSVLNGIYGNKPKINYPKPKIAKKSAFDPTKQRFNPVNAPIVHGASDPKRTTTRDTSNILVVPKGFNGGYKRKSYAPVDFISHRKSADEIRQEVNVVNERIKAYRPAGRKMIDNNEKERYIQVCQYKGGKGLMEGIAAVPTLAPYEIAEKNKFKEMEIKFRLTRKGLSQRAESNINIPQITSKLSEKDILANQIQCEINERCQHLEDMQNMGKGAMSKKDITVIQNEIKSRTLELIKLEGL